VAFDPRTSRPEFLDGQLGAYSPTRPYFLTSFNRQMAGFVPAGAGLDGPVSGGTSEPTLSIELSGASWDPATGTCTSVACHLQETSVRWGSTAYDPDPASPGIMPFEPCVACHPY
jgi:predicted CxxxxCH...CXXCH cytochrome family protein